MVLMVVMDVVVLMRVVSVVCSGMLEVDHSGVASLCWKELEFEIFEFGGDFVVVLVKIKVYGLAAHVYIYLDLMQLLGCKGVFSLQLR